MVTGHPSYEEEPLCGGRLTPGVVRVGHTVRRPGGANASFVGHLLSCLETAGLEASPRFLGVDERGRDILTFVEGTVPTDIDAGWSDDEVAWQPRGRRAHNAALSAASSRTSSGTNPFAPSDPSASGLR